MAEAEQKTLADLRQLIIDGVIPAGERLSEVSVAEMMGVSRTPAKLALARLEMTGLISKRPGRGYTVRKVSLTDMKKVISLRGVLEGAAAAAMARNDVSATALSDLDASIEMTDAIVRKCAISLDDVETYQRANTLFHETIMYACGDEYIPLAFEPIRHFPLAALGTHVPNPELLDRERLRMSVGHAQHIIVASAIRDRDAMRAQAVMQEHSNATFEYARLFVGEHSAEHIPSLLKSV